MDKGWKLKLAISGAILGMAVIFLSTIGYGIYKLDWQNDFIMRVTKVLPYPAALVNGQIVKFYDWRDNLKDWKYFYSKKDELQLDLSNVPTEDEMKTSELDHLIDMALLKQIAKTRGVTVSDADVDNEYQNTIVPQAGSAAEVESTLKDLYNWTPAQFKQKILYEVVLRQKINDSLDTAEQQAEKKQQAEKLLADIKAGTLTFEDAAKQYGEDSTAEKGGDLGYFAKGDMVKNFEDAAFALEPGQISEVIRTQYGYHLIKLEDKKTEDGAEKVRARHILIKLFGVDDLLESERNSAKIKRFF